MRVGVELVPDVLWGYRFGAPLTRRLRNRTSAKRSVRERVYGRDGRRCQNPFCNGTENKLGTDHFIASSRGGSGHHTNLQVLCRKCDGRKGAMLPGDFVTLEMLASLAPECDLREQDLATLRRKIRAWLEQPFRHETDVSSRQETT